MNINLLTKYLNRYFRRDERVIDWSYELDYHLGDGLIIRVDYKESYHQAKKISIFELNSVKSKDFEEFSQYLYRDISHRQEEEVILRACDIK